MRTLINIGLATSDGPLIPPGHALGILKAVGGAQVRDARVYPSDTEPTLVAEVEYPLYAASAFAVADALRQDAIAQWDGREGSLYGPAAAAWGQFDPAAFLTLDGQRLSARAAA